MKSVQSPCTVSVVFYFFGRITYDNEDRNVEDCGTISDRSQHNCNILLCARYATYDENFKRVGNIISVTYDIESGQQWSY